MQVNVFNHGDAVLPGSGYMPIEGFNFPVSDGLRGLFLCGDGLSIARRNFAGLGDAEIIGAPAEHEGFCRFDAGNYLQTQIAETAALTYIVVGRRPTESTGAEATFIGNYAPGSIGATMYTSSSGSAMTANADRSPAGSTTASVVTDVSAMGLYVMTAPASGGPTWLYAMTAGLQNGSTNTNPRAVTGAGLLRIGAVYAATFSGAADIVTAAVLDRVITDDERAAIAVWARNYAGQFGFAV
ncbi:hypothetical protein D8I35_09390 [Corticibacter populi]|uniref:Uncharacterized protein n=1 Tax=Corticibacter populi TaxID=1550736 RepID=A0A3M6QUJ9_9BURK|nr:hypothetical protein [Corticibacter populi]RMX06704.1 hypothetical protein D8I35_09390 [Corticibacter populi]RZS31715.1 hypothetical protein EV687_2384 [Corticibacter populi]